MTVRLLSLETHASLAAAHDPRPEMRRLLTVVSVHDGAEDDPTTGWGECNALNNIGYTPESAETAFTVLAGASDLDAAPMAFSALEMALLDRELKTAEISLSEHLGTSGQRSIAGAVVGLGTIPSMLDACEELAGAGYQRLKVKIAPGRVVEPIRAIASRFSELELHVDANASLTGDDLPLLRSLRDLGVRAVEQPFAIGDHGPAARLVDETDMAVVADEAAVTVEQIDVLARDRAATAVAVKPGRAGGLANTLALLDQLTLHGMLGCIGGMLESGLGRHVLAAIAPLPVFTLAGDLSPAGRWLAVDPFNDIALVDGHIEAPSQPGVAGSVDRVAIDAHTIAMAEVPLSPVTT